MNMHPVDAIKADWLSMEDQIDQAREGQRKAEELSIQLATERDVLVENLDRMATELNFWRAYAIKLDTRLDVISSVIAEAKDDAVRRAKEDAKAPRPDLVALNVPDVNDPARIIDTLQNLEPRMPLLQY